MDDEFVKPAKRHFPMPGMEIWKNPKNQFCVVEVHYKADPKKRNDVEWQKATRAGMPYRDYMREYELSWETWEGTPVFPDWDDANHCTEEELLPHIGLPIMRGWDFGLTPACVVAQLQEDQLVVLKEFVAFNMGLERFSEIVLQQCATLFPMWRDRKRDWMELIDPSGEARKDTDEGSCAKLLDGKGLRVLTGAIAFEERRKSVEYFLTRRTRQGYGLKVSRQNAPWLVKGFKGGYQYPERVADAQSGELRPLKNKYSHVHDAFQMITSKLKPKARRKSATPPNPSYGFTRDRNYGG